jgi:hypothetical protein
MGCDKSQLQLRYLDGLSYGVTGCGKKVIFAYDCGNEAGCTWRQEKVAAQ